MGSYSIREISFVSQLDRAKKDLEDIKSNQGISRSGIATKRTESPLIESTTANVAFPGPLLREITYLTVTFLADTQKSPYGRLVLIFYDYNDQTKVLDSTSGIMVNYLNDIVTYVDDGMLKWNVDARASGAGTIGLNKYYCQLIVHGTDSGRITWKNAWEN